MQKHLTLGDSGRENNFGLLRLLFASLVIMAHSPELIDGNRSREILTRIFGTMTFGELAVDGFFIISGYLVTKSFVQTGSVKSFFLKRFIRIFPGYAVCFFICYFLLAQFVGGDSFALSLTEVRRLIHDIVFLLPPNVPGAFQGLHYAALNGSMWTITWEFRCYVAAALVGVLGLYRPSYRRPLLIGVGILLLLNILDIMIYHSPFASGRSMIRFPAVFGTGAAYYLFRDRVKFTNFGAAISAAILVAMMFFWNFAELAFCLFGGYIIFWFAFKVSVLRISRLDNKSDISYGLYLYAWPVQSLFIWFYPNINPWLLSGVALICAGCIAYVSWALVEKPCLCLVQKRRLVEEGLVPVQSMA